MPDSPYERMADVFGHVDPSPDLEPGVLRHVRKALSVLGDAAAARSTYEPYRRRLERAGVRLEGARVLDVGCGTGVFGVLFLFCGARECFGFDVDRTRLQAAEVLRGMLPDEYAGRLAAVECDAGEFAAETGFDLAFCNEVVSHLNDTGYLAGLRERLVEGGCLFISDGNNPLNPWTARVHRDFYRRRELGPPGAAMGRKIDRPFQALRAEMIAERYAERISSEDVERLAAETSGLAREEFREACHACVEDGVWPRRVYVPGAAPVHPKTGIKSEAMLDPFALCRELAEAGYVRCRADGSLPGAFRLAPLGWLDRLLPARLKLFFAGGYTVAAFRGGGGAGR